MLSEEGFPSQSSDRFEHMTSCHLSMLNRGGKKRYIVLDSSNDDATVESEYFIFNVNVNFSFSFYRQTHFRETYHRLVNTTGHLTASYSTLLAPSCPADVPYFSGYSVDEPALLCLASRETRKRIVMTPALSCPTYRVTFFLLYGSDCSPHPPSAVRLLLARRRGGRDQHPMPGRER